MSEHTALPWKVSNGSDRLIYGGADGERWVASVIGRDAQGVTDAAHIIHCVNAHDELVAVLTEARQCVQVYITKYDFTKGNEILARLDAALAKATQP